jgi:hypothetical protein
MPHVPESDRIRLDNPSLEGRAATYPPELREPFIWLGCYVREECSREIDILTERARKLGINSDKTTWSKVLRGKWNRDARGRETTPCVQLEKLLRHIELLRNDARIKEMSGRIPFVETGTTKKIFQFIDIKRTPDRVNKMGVVIGETGSQKTAAFQEYQRQNNHGTTVWMDAPEVPSMFKFKTDLAACFGCHPSVSVPRKEAKIAESVNDRKTIIVENIQRLYQPHEEGNQPVFNYLQKLQEVTHCTLILSFTPTFERTFTAGLNKGFFEQFVGRAGGINRFLRLPDYPPEEDVIAIARGFKLRDADKHVKYLVGIAREPGRIRRLFEDLQDAKIEAELSKEPLTIEHVKTVREED